MDFEAEITKRDADAAFRWTSADKLAFAQQIHAATLAEEIIAVLEAREKERDNPQWDATEAAHPAWWRGNDAGVAVLCEKINAILDGDYNGSGVASDPWETVKRRLLQIGCLCRNRAGAGEGDHSRRSRDVGWSRVANQIALPFQGRVPEIRAVLGATQGWWRMVARGNTIGV